MMRGIALRFVATLAIAILVSPLIERLVDPTVTFARASEPSGQTDPESKVQQSTTPHVKPMGVKECAACHTQPGFLYPLNNVTQFVRLTEAEQWYRNDKHAFAYELVRVDLTESEFDRPERQSNRRVRDMLIQLGWKTGDGNFERKCLSCHAGITPKDDWRDNSFQQNLAYGVQCEACHGRAEKYMQTSEHQQPSWRTKSAEEKSALGMSDLSIAAVSADVCLSCHLGNIPQGRLVTHDMYAAGHPPFPPFELQTFLDAMPPHWGTIQAKPYPNPPGDHRSPTFQHQRQYLMNHFAFDASQSTEAMQDQVQRSMERTKRSMVGFMVAQNMALQLIDDASRQPDYWGDYALFDCMGCHQNLDEERPRYRPAGRIPGRPFPPTWSLPTIEIAAGNDTSALVRSKFEHVFNAIPFGDRDRWELERASFENFLASRRQHAMEQSRLMIDPSDTKGWVDLVIREQSPKLNDYWAAKQTAWLVRIAVDELIAKKHLESSMVADDLQALERILALKLQIPQQQSVLIEQPSTLDIAQSFDVASVRKHLEAIQIALRRP